MIMKRLSVLAAIALMLFLSGGPSLSEGALVGG